MDEERLIAIDIPPNVNYKDVKTYLDKQSNQKILGYKEACLSETHPEYL